MYIPAVAVTRCVTEYQNRKNIFCNTKLASYFVFGAHVPKWSGTTGAYFIIKRTLKTNLTSVL